MEETIKILEIDVPKEEAEFLFNEQAYNGKVLRVVDGKVVAIDPPVDEEAILEGKRARRRHLLDAFDKWEKAVICGREEDDAAVMRWYRALLDLKETAFDAIPDRIRYYLS